MGFQLWSQSNFTKGELSPYMYARSDTQQYFNGMKTAQNVLCYPTGAAGKRFGTLYQATLNAAITSTNLYFTVFQYLNECIYQLVFYPLNIDIYLEGILVANVTTTLDGQSVYNLSTTVLQNAFRVAGQGFKPYDLVRNSFSPNVITGVSGNVFSLTSAVFGGGGIAPGQFTNAGGALPTTTPQIKAGITYFIFANSTSTFTVYATASDAKFQINPFIVTNAGTGTNSFLFLNNWSFAHSVFSNLPVYDFNGVVVSYDALTFTPSAVNGASVTITVSGGGYSKLDSTYVGGAFIGNGGVTRITAVASHTSFTVAVQNPFNTTDPILGAVAFLAEPAWSDARGWPQICSSYQNRALFANTVSLPNGFWASSINDYADFNDLQTDDDNAISWFPTSNDINFIRFIVPYRSITVHTNSGIYSSPLSDVSAITPSNFSLQLQDSTPADVLEPTAIDNQIIVISGDDVHTMLWDGINNAYTSDIVSVPSEQLIRSPVDEAHFADLHRAGSRYVFIINANGSMAIYQTLLAQSVSGFTPAILEQSYGSAFFRQSSSSSDGRCWFVNEREIAIEQGAIAITGFTSTSIHVVGSQFPTDTSHSLKFLTTGTLPASTPAVNTTDYFWGVAVDADNITIYTNQADALAGTNPIIFTSAGTSSTVKEWKPTSTFILEELTQDVRLDCAVYYTGSPTDTVTTGALFNSQSVKMLGDGFGFDAEGNNNAVVFEAHGSTVDVSTAYVGFPINLILEPMPITMPSNYGSAPSVLPRPKHIRSVQFMFNNTVGGAINGVPIALNRFTTMVIGDPPIPASGIFEMGIMSGWDNFNNPTFTITHNEPFNIELLGVFYGLEI